MLTGALPLVVDVWGVGVVVSMYVCVAWGLLPPWFCWCVGGLVVGGVHGVGVLVFVVCCVGDYTLVVWCVGDLVCVCPCMFAPEWDAAPLWVGGVGVSVVCWLGVAPCGFGVLVMWCVCPCMCVPEGLLPPSWVGGVGVLVV